MSEQFRRNIGKLIFSALFLALYIEPVEALTQDISAVFIPDPTNPMRNEFRNTTPVSGVCQGHMPERCKQLGIFSIRTPGFSANAIAPINAFHADERQGAMWKVPSEWRDVQVTHTRTGEVKTVQVRIAGIGHRWDVRPNTSAWAVPGGSWQGRWQSAPSPCQSSNFLTGNSTMAIFFWIVPEGAGVCSRQPGTDITRFWYSTFEFAYALKTPNPLDMSSGQYTGVLTYTMGPQADFDFGDVVIPGDSELTLNFTLDVMHALKVDIPPGGNRIELVPQGGWQAWLNQGRKPVRLFRDQTFNISASSRFKMQLECQFVAGNTCALRDAGAADLVPLNTSVTLPYGLTDGTGQPVDRRPLRLDGSGTELFQPGLYVDRKPGVLHFEVAREHVEQMLQDGNGKTYSGDITVIWDSEVI
ncbi:hypothetical protein KVG88_08665 [Pseudomonas sp. SWRI74]|uniref:Fimbrial protein n=1 Tax=Pseudomonas azerbaijanoccidentalis TaxID=2842347 RepID=A0ABS6QMG2_9PSED|nr:hypothetical protein [Pseudomonas azerbaijanoccidentalis]MBV4520132.1 hypothetical protein [Pseudomonas azerbaijanoccidentalis]